MKRFLISLKHGISHYFNGSNSELPLFSFVVLDFLSQFYITVLAYLRRARIFLCITVALLADLCYDLFPEHTVARAEVPGYRNVLSLVFASISEAELSSHPSFHQFGQLMLEKIKYCGARASLTF